MNGITYYRLKSDYAGDVTKNCALTGSEVDANFYTLEGRDIKSIEVNDKDIVITLYNGDIVRATNALKPVQDEIDAQVDRLESAIYKGSYDESKGILYLTDFRGQVQAIDGFLTSMSNNLSTDNTLSGNGTPSSPLGISPAYLSGYLRPVKDVIKINEGEKLPSGPNVKIGDRYLTVEDISDYGYLYNYEAVKSIACALLDSKSPWRIPSKDDWDDMLNAIEPNKDYKNHESAALNRFLGQYAGKLIKSKDLWKEVSEGQSGSECDTCPKRHNCKDYHTSGCNCCHKTYDYSDVANNCTRYDDPCSGNTSAENGTACPPDTTNPYKGLDAYGFRAVPAGYGDDTGMTHQFKERAYFWTSTNNGDTAYYKRLQYDRNDVYQDTFPFQNYLSIRLVKDYDGNNFRDTENILNDTYPTVLMPSVANGHAVWTQINVFDASASLDPLSPNAGSGLSYTRRYFVNEWDGNEWVRKELKEGESLSVKQPNGTYIQYIVSEGNLTNTPETVYQQVMEDILPQINEMENALKESIKDVDSKLDDETQNRIDGDKANSDAIAAEAQTRQDEDAKLYETIGNEAQTRQDEDAKLYDAINKEEAARQDVDNQQWTAINNESAIREAEDKKLYDALAQENDARQEVDKQQWTAIENEGTIREAEDKKIYENLEKESTLREQIDNEQWSAINTEREERKAKDEELEGKFIVSGTYDNSTGIMTLNRANGSEHVDVQFSFDFGTF